MDNKALGKGLSALIQEKSEIVRTESVAFVKTNLIKENRLQPRTHYNEAQLADLVASIKEKGILQPILVRKSGNDYEVVAGERRLRAARLLNFEEVPVIVKTVTDREALVLALVENIQREGLNPIEEAQGFKRLIEEFEFTQENVAQSVGKDRATIANLLRLFKLPEEIQKGIFENTLSVGHARALLGVDDKKEQKKLFTQILRRGLSVREVERTVQKLHRPGTGKKSPAQDRDVALLEEDLGKVLGTKVRIQGKSKKGKLVIEYYSLDDFDRILAKLRA